MTPHPLPVLAVVGVGVGHHLDGDKTVLVGTGATTPVVRRDPKGVVMNVGRHIAFVQRTNCEKPCRSRAWLLSTKLQLECLERSLSGALGLRLETSLGPLSTVVEAVRNLHGRELRRTTSEKPFMRRALAVTWSCVN